MIGEFFNLVLIDPLTNLFVFLAVLLGNSGLAIIALTLIIRVVTLPLQIRQIRMTRIMGALAPKVQDIQQRYSDPKLRSEEQMKLYREVGVNPLGCLGPMIIQLPIFVALYATFRLALGESPESTAALSTRLYDWNFLTSAVPLGLRFLWMNLAQPDPFVIPVTVAVSTYIYQKMSSLPPRNKQQAAQTNIVNMLMPLLFGYFALILPSALGLYFVVSNLIGIAILRFYGPGEPFNWAGPA